MLNRALADEFRKVHDEERTGALVVLRGDSQLRFYFDAGELLLLDYGIDKELLLLRQYRSYHKIGFEIESVVEQMLRSGTGIRTKDYLLQQQLVTQDEVEQVTRTLVEDTLCECFGNPAERMFWDAGAHIESFDLERSAVKLRIQVELLLTMVEGRVAERDAVHREIPDYGLIFSLVEGAPSPKHLNEMERNALHFIDGRKSVEDIAAGIRESSLNTACYLVSLQTQGFISRSRTNTAASGRLSASSGPATPVRSASRPEIEPSPTEAATIPAQMAPPPGTPPMAEPEVVIHREEARNSRAPMILVLLAVLSVMVWVGILVVQSQQRQAVIDELRDEIHAATRAGDWASAERMLEDARNQAGNDQVLQAKLDDFVAIENIGFDQELANLAAAIEEDDIAEAERLMSDQPLDPLVYDGLWSGASAASLEDLRQRLDARKSELEEQARQFRHKIEAWLSGGSVDVAMEEIHGAHPVLQVAGQQVLRDWRVELLSKAADGTRSIGERERLLDSVAKADPSEENLRTLDQIQNDIDRIRAVVTAAIATMQRELQAGDYQTVISKAQDNASLAAGSELAGKISALRQQAEDLQAQLSELVDEAARLVRTSRDRQAIAEVASKLSARVEEMPQAANLDALQEASQIMAAVLDSLTRETTADELAALRVIELDAEEAGLSSTRQALLSRRQELETREERATRDVERAREEFARGSLDQAEAAYQAILGREDYRRTDAYAAAETGLETVRQERVKRQARFGALRLAMLADDVDMVTRMAREMALPRLPVLVRSLPPGALVSADGSELGTTPFILEDLSADRVDQKLTISLEGYQTVVVDPAEAAGGWRIQLDLVRAPSQVMDLGANVTSEPATIDGQVWLIGKRHVFAVDGEISRFGLDSTGGIGRSLGNPVYAPAQAIGDRIYVTTRDQIALRIEGDAVTRLPLAAETNLPLARYASPLVLDREVLVVAGLDQRLAASDNLDKPRLWTGAVGAPFACAPQVVGDGVLGLRRDGTGEVYACDTGRLLSSIDLGEPVVAAWREDGGIVAYTQKRQIRWDGVQLIKGEDLPESVIDGAAGVVITAGQSVNLVDEDGSWRLIGRYEANRKLLAPPVRWGEHVAITSANEVVVVGSRPFTVKANGDILRPTVLGNRLVVADVAGRLNFYEP